jgi:hypothetical protein
MARESGVKRAPSTFRDRNALLTISRMLAFASSIALLVGLLFVLSKVARRSRMPWPRLVGAGVAITAGLGLGALPGLILAALTTVAVVTGPPPGGAHWGWIGTLTTLGAAGGVALGAALGGRRLGRTAARAFRSVLGSVVGTALAWLLADFVCREGSLAVTLFLVLAIPLTGLVGFASLART